VGGNPRKKSFWKLVLNKLKTRLSVWKGRFLSMAGRICVIKFVFTAIPLFNLSVFKASESIYKSIISIQRRFMWGWGKENRPISWVSWEDLCKPQEEGGLGFKDIRKREGRGGELHAGESCTRGIAEEGTEESCRRGGN